jgi:hypothetical protein
MSTPIDGNDPVVSEPVSSPKRASSGKTRPRGRKRCTCDSFGVCEECAAIVARRELALRKARGLE